SGTRDAPFFLIGSAPIDAVTAGDIRTGASRARRPHDRGDATMNATQVSLPELVLIAGTRAAIGAGIALLLADRLPADQRRAVGWTLLLLGAVSTIPLAFEVFGNGRLTNAARQWQPPGESRFQG